MKGVKKKDRFGGGKDDRISEEKQKSLRAMLRIVLSISIGCSELLHKQ
jgi:hypothetical protein